MNFLELAKSRHSCRNFLPQEVEEEKIQYVLECGRVAPSAKNNQPWHFIVVRKKENLEQLWRTYKKDWIKTAPCVIIVCGDHDLAWRRPDGKDHCNIDIAVTIDHITLAAADAGLATCWVCNFDVMQCNEILNLPSQIEPIALVPIGYPANNVDADRHATERKRLDEITHKEKFTYKAFK